MVTTWLSQALDLVMPVSGSGWRGHHFAGAAKLCPGTQIQGSLPPPPFVFAWLITVAGRPVIASRYHNHSFHNFGS